jgi:hypothetical protein
LPILPSGNFYGIGVCIGGGIGTQLILAWIFQSFFIPWLLKLNFYWVALSAAFFVVCRLLLVGRLPVWLSRSG